VSAAVETLTTLEAILRELIGPEKRGNPVHPSTMTPTRYSHACDLLVAGVDSELVFGAVNRLLAAPWLKKSPLEMTDTDVERARELAQVNP
jgi:hypothetical protein